MFKIITFPRLILVVLKNKCNLHIAPTRTHQHITTQSVVWHHYHNWWWW